jgi:hypothetical protein
MCFFVVYVSLCVCMHICVCVLFDLCVHLFAPFCITYVLKYTHTRAREQEYIQMHVYILSIHIYFPYIGACMHTYIHTYIHIYLKQR